MRRKLCEPSAFRWVLLWAVVALMLLPVSSRADCVAQTITADMADKVNTTNVQLLMLEDPERALDAESVAALSISEFTPSNGTLTSAMEGGYIWLRLCLQRGAEAPDQWLLTLLPPYLNSIATYQFSDEGFTEHEQGFILPFDWREINYRGFTYPVSLASNEPEQFVIRIDFVRRVAADILLLTPEKLYQLMAVEYSFFGFYLGMLVLVIFINLVFWSRLKDTLYLRYALAMLSVGVFSIITGGYASQFIATGGGSHMYTALMVNFCICGVLLTFFVQSAFQFKRFYPLVYKISWAIIFCYSLLALMAFFVEPFVINKYRALVSVVFIPLVTLVSLHALAFHKSIRLYAIAFLPLQLIFLLGFLRNTGIVTAVPLADHLPNIGALAHLLLLNMALAKRAWQAEKDKTNARNELLEQTRKTAQKLEVLVMQRTCELDKANADLQAKINEGEIIEAQLRQALVSENRALQVQRQFTAMVSHEFRTPLTIIDTAAQNLEVQFAEDASGVMPRLGRIRNGVKRMLTLMDNCLTEARLASYSTAHIHFQREDLSVFVKNYFSDKDYWHRLQVHCPNAPVMINIDIQLLGILLNNLISNALKYSPPEEPVTLTLRVIDTVAQLDVCDRGVGVSEADREWIFEKFYRASNVQGYPGAGLGLYLSRELAERHGGELVLLPSTAHPGSCFRLTLPLVLVDE